jgi:hypothetical protein
VIGRYYAEVAFNVLNLERKGMTRPPRNGGQSVVSSLGLAYLRIGIEEAGRLTFVFRDISELGNALRSGKFINILLFIYLNIMNRHPRRYCSGLSTRYSKIESSILFHRPETLRSHA